MDAGQVSLKGKTAIVTGANGGIGKETAKQLAKRGARVILACRDVAKAEAARNEINDWVGDNCEVVVKRIDLSSLRSVREFAEDVIKNESRVDLLVNNAGVIASVRQETEDGFEIHFAVNHLGHFLLTYLLLPKLELCRPSRVVTVSSVAHSFYNVDFNDLQTRRRWNVFKAYGRSKTANILFTTHLASLLKDRGITSYSLHPGLVRTDLGRELEGTVSSRCFRALWGCFRVRLLTPEEGARTSVYCCLEPSIVSRSGQYYSDCKEKPPRSFACDASAAEHLWTVSCQSCHVPIDPFHVRPTTCTETMP